MHVERKKRRNRIKIDEEFDRDIPMARAVRAVLSPEPVMDDEARKRVVQHVLAMQRSVHRRDARPAWRNRRVLAPALSVILVLLLGLAVALPLVLSGGRKPSAPGEPTYARFIELEGDVRVKPPGMETRRAAPGNSIAEGWSIRTGDGTAAIGFSDGSIARITDGSGVRVERIRPEEVAIRHLSGSTYHRVHKGTVYSVSYQDITSRALGTAFNVDNREPGRLEILTVESAVEVSIGTHEPIKVSEGEVMNVSLHQDKKAGKQPVSLERLQEDRLMASVRQDAQAGFPTGIYESAGVERNAPESTPVARDAKAGIVLEGTVGEMAASLTWKTQGNSSFSEYVLLRSEGAEPAFPGSEIARYTDASITSASDNSLQAGRTYSYRIAGIASDGADVVFSNTVILSKPMPEKQPTPVALSVTGSVQTAGIKVEWSVSGASAFDGFVLERVVDRCPPGSPTPVGHTSYNKFTTSDVFYSFLDNSVMPGHVYGYRVGLIVNNSTMVFSDWVRAEFTRK